MYVFDPMRYLRVVATHSEEDLHGEAVKIVALIDNPSDENAHALFGKPRRSSRVVGIASVIGLAAIAGAGEGLMNSGRPALAWLCYGAVLAYAGAAWWRKRLRSP